MKVPKHYRTSQFGSHWHLLEMVMGYFHPTHVLETGSGLYSTPLLLSYPIDVLVSLENNRDWVIDSGDVRHEVIEVEGPIAPALPSLVDFDLIFVDDDPIEAREQTIARVIDEAPGLVMIHDTDWTPFHQFIAKRPNWTDTERFPNTTVIHPVESQEFIEWLGS